MVPMAILSDLYTEISFLFGFRVRYKAGAWSLSNISSSGWPLLKHSGHVTTLSEHQRGGIVLPRWPAPLSPSRLDICSLRSKKRFGRLQVSRPFLLSLEMGILGGFGILLVQIKVVDVALGNIYGQPGESGEKMALVGENGCPNTVETSSPGAVLGTAASVLAKTVSESWTRIGDMAGKFALLMQGCINTRWYKRQMAHMRRGLFAILMHFYVFSISKCELLLKGLPTFYKSAV